MGSLDASVIELNQRAQRELRHENRLEIIAGATHLFEEPGTLERVADLARSWFESSSPKAAAGMINNEAIESGIR